MGWVASGSYCVPGSDKAPAAIPKKWLVSDRLARERQLLHSLRVRSCESQPMPHRFGSDEQMFGAK